jgi:hypothetical protein
MMKYISIVLSVILVCSLSAAESVNDRNNLSEQMKDSIVYLGISSHGYSQIEPWKQKNISEDWACACAISEYEVITIADKVINLAFLRALRYGQNEFINAQLKVVDYQANLCLIQLDPNQLAQPLKPLKFTEEYPKGENTDCYWLSSNNRLFNGRGYLDRARVQRAPASYGKYLRLIVSDTTQGTDSGEVYCIDSTPIGIACLSLENESALIPGETINRFLKAVADNNYEGFGNVGFAISELLDPAMRSFLKMPESLTNGVYVADVYNLGTGHETLQKADVILKIDGNNIDSYGRFEHPKYEEISFDHLITGKNVGQNIDLQVWRDGQKTEIQTDIKNFKASEMLVPYYEYDRQPEFIVISGFVFQKLTREYLAEFGRDIAGDSPSHLYHYYRDLAFKPDEQRRDIVVLSYVLPSQFNLGYAGVGQSVVSKFNGMEISSIKDILTAQKLNSESNFDVIEFELDEPVVVISREQIPVANAFVTQNYGVSKLSNIDQ